MIFLFFMRMSWHGVRLGGGGEYQDPVEGAPFGTAVSPKGGADKVVARMS